MTKHWLDDRINWIESHPSQLSAVQNSILSDKISVSFRLEQNYPQPINAVATIKYQLLRPTKVALTIINQAGQEVLQLIDRTQPAGVCQISRAGKNWAGVRVASSVYLLQLRADDSQFF